MPSQNTGQYMWLQHVRERQLRWPQYWRKTLEERSNDAYLATAAMGRNTTRTVTRAAWLQVSWMLHPASFVLRQALWREVNAGAYEEERKETA